MRVNIYGEELREINDGDGDRVTLIREKVVSSFEHSAIQILLGDRVIHTEKNGRRDDDTPAVKFWYADEHQRKLLVRIFKKALEELDKPEAATQRATTSTEDTMEPTTLESPNKPESIAARFNRLANAWEQATGNLSSMKAASEHPAYQEIISLGRDVVPYLLRDLQENERHWFIALRTITGADPIPKAAAGNVPKMIEAWLQWGKENGY
jgi:hypothetical protein